LAEQHQAAIETLKQIPLKASCGRRAAFERAEALYSLGQQGEAAQIYEKVGSLITGHERVQETTTWMKSLAEERLKRGEIDQGQQILELALGLEIKEEERLSLARTLAEKILAHKDHHNHSARNAVKAPLWRAILSAPLGPEISGSVQLLARLLSAKEGFSLLEAEPKSPRLMELRAMLMDGYSREQADPLRQALLKEFPQSEEAQRARQARLRFLRDKGRLEAARPLIKQLLKSPDAAVAMQASRDGIALLQQTGDQEKLVEALSTHLKSFPSDPERIQQESSLDLALLYSAREAFKGGDYEGAIRRYNHLIQRDPRSAYAGSAAIEAALSARAKGDLEESERRLREILARWPSEGKRAVEILIREHLFDKGRPLADLPALKIPDRFRAEIQQEQQRLEGHALKIETPDQQAPGAEARIRILTRNIKSLEARLHYIDAEAYLRAGGTPEALPGLDVAVIAPDHSWKIEVPEYMEHKDLDFYLDLPQPKPGLYMVTVAGGELEAAAVLWISKLRLVAQASGSELAAAVFDLQGKPVPGARILRRVGGRVLGGKSDKQGLFRSLIKAGPVTLLAIHEGSAVLLHLPRNTQPHSKAPIKLSGDLDRPVYRPGDLLHFRLYGRQGEAVLKGELKVSLHSADYESPPLRLQFAPLGTVEGSFLVPAQLTGPRPLSIMAQLPSQERASQVLSALIVSEQPEAPRLEGKMEGDMALFWVLDAQGAPMPDQLIQWTEPRSGDELQRRRTDDQGQIRVKGPALQRPWWIQAKLFEGDSLNLRRKGPPEEPLSLWTLERLRPGEQGKLSLRGRGPVTLSLHRLSPPKKQHEALKDPWLPELNGDLRAPQTWLSLPSENNQGIELEELWSKELELKGEALELSLPPLEAGRYRLRALSAKGRYSSERCIHVKPEGLLLRGAEPLALGEKLALSLEGGHALVTVIGQGNRLQAAAILGPQEIASWEPRGRWGEQLRINALAPDGSSHSQALRFENQLKLELKQHEEEGEWRIQVQVREPSGRPVKAEVLLSLLDSRLEESTGSRPQLSQAEVYSLPSLTPPVWGLAQRLGSGMEGRPLAAALLADNRFEQELLQAQVAQGGSFLSLRRRPRRAMIQNSMPYEQSESFDPGWSPKLQIKGERSSLLWRQVQTDAQGYLELRIPRPTRAARWNLSAQALSAEAFGIKVQTIDTLTRPRLILSEPGGGAPGELALLKVRVLNPGVGAFKGILKVDRSPQRVELAPGESLSLDLGLRPAGTEARISLEAKGRLLDEQLWSFPLLEGRPDPEGRVLNIAVDPGGGFPTALLALRDDPDFGRDVGRAATAGRIALEALKWVKEGQRPALIRRVKAAHIMTKSRDPQDARAGAEVLLFLAEAKALLKLPQAELKAMAAQIPGEALDRETRLWLLYAQSYAGLKVDQSQVDRLLRQAEQLKPESRALLARLLQLLKRPVEGLIQGNSPQAILARRNLGIQSAPPTLSPPAVGAYGGAEWLACVAQAPHQGAGVQQVKLNGESLGTLNLSAGGLLRLNRELSRSQIEISGARPFIWRSDPAPRGEAKAKLLRVPAEFPPLGRHEEDVWFEPKAPGALFCAEPCLLSLGDRLYIDADLSLRGWQPPAGFRLSQNRRFLIATSEAEAILRDLKIINAQGESSLMAPRHLQIKAKAPSLKQLAQPYALWQAQRALDEDQDPRPFLDNWPGDEDGAPDLRPQAAEIRFRYALKRGTTPTEILDRFEALKAASPRANLSLEQVVRVAQAYRAVGRLERAVETWRTALGAAFLAETGTLRRLEDVAGLLPMLKGLYALDGSYPPISPVEEALYLLPQRLGEMADEPLPQSLSAAGITATKLRLQAAAWDREFLALWPQSPHRPEAGFHLIQLLLELKAPERAAYWAAQLSAAHPKSHLRDELIYLEGLARAQLREDKAALSAFEQVAQEEFLGEDGLLSFSESRGDAGYAAARLYEAQGDLKRALSAYRRAADQHPEAKQAINALEDVRLRPRERLNVLGDEEALLPVEVANLKVLHMRAYKLDLRTLFLRDSGLSRVRAVRIDGLSPSWSGQHKINAGSFPKEIKVPLPLKEPGAYLIQINGGGEQGLSLLLRSDLRIDLMGYGASARLRVFRKGQPAAGITVRAIRHGRPLRLETDLRGVALVPVGPVLVQDGPHFAFEESATLDKKDGFFNFDEQESAPNRPGKSIKRKLRRQIKGNRRRFERRFKKENKSMINMELM